MKYVDWDGQRWGLYSGGYYANKSDYLHRAKWKKLRGPIPKGYHVHHKNHDKTDNRIANLVCISQSEHAREHKMGFTITPQHQAKLQAAIAKDKVAWSAKRVATSNAKPNITVVCQWCEKTFPTRRTSRKTCSQWCRDQKSYYTRKAK